MKKKLLGYSALASVIGVVGISSEAHAALIASENFSYTAGTTLRGENGGTGAWTGAWTTSAGYLDATMPTSPVNLVAPGWGGAISSNATEQTPSAGVTGYDDYRNVAISTASTDASNTVWFSYLIKDSQAAQTSTWFIMEGTIAATSSPGNVDFGAFSTSYPDTWGMLATGQSEQSSGVALSSSTTLMVGSINLTSGVVNLYVNPTTTTVPGSASATSTIAGVSSSDPLSEYEVQLYVNNGVTNQVYYGGINIGQEYADVVPEPSMLAMVFLPAAMLLTRRRRRKTDAMPTQAGVDPGSAATDGSVNENECAR